MAEAKKVGSLSTQLDTELVENDKRLRELAKKFDVPMDVYRKYLERAVSKAMVNFEISDLYSVGHRELSPELQAKRSYRENAVQKAKESRKGNLIHHSVAKNDAQSLHFLHSLPVVPTDAEIAAWNKGVKTISAMLAKILRKRNTNDGEKEYSTRRLQHNIADIQIFDGWCTYDKLATKILRDALRTVEKKSVNNSFEPGHDQRIFDLQADDAKANGETASLAQVEPTPFALDANKKPGIIEAAKKALSGAQPPSA